MDRYVRIERAVEPEARTHDRGILIGLPGTPTVWLEPHQALLLIYRISGALRGALEDVE